MKTTLMLLATLGFISNASADLSQTCEKEAKQEGLEIVTAADSETIAQVKRKLARKLKINSSQLVYSQSMTAGDGAAGFYVIVYQAFDAKKNPVGWYSTIAHEGAEISHHQLITD